MVKYEYAEGWFGLNDIDLPEGTVVLARVLRRPENKIYLWYLKPKE